MDIYIALLSAQMAYGYWVFSSLGNLTLGFLSVLLASSFIVRKLSNISVPGWEIITAFISFSC
jgi:hypothetical protein